jgi:hypothetical protein
MSQPPQMVDQILISWSERTLTERRGIGPTASSIRSREELAGWEQRLLSADWAAAEVGAGVLQPALVYLQFGEEAAVLHKKPVPDPNGRPGSTLAHALVGPASVLGAREALGLHGWGGWIQQEPASLGGLDGPSRLTMLDAGDLRRAAEAGYQKLGEDARRLDPYLLAALFATLLSDPLGRFSFSPADTAGQDDDLEVKLLCGVVDAFGDTTGQDWTFSTCEAEEPSAAGRPRLVFLSQTQGFSTRVPTGHRAPLGQLCWFGQKADALEAGVLRTFGETLAETFALNPEVLGRLRPRLPVTSTHEAITWALDAEFAPGVPADFGNVLLTIGYGRADPAVLERLPARPEILETGVRALTDAMLSRLGALWGPGTEPAASCPQVAGALQRETAWRFASEAQPVFAATVTEFGVPLTVWLEQLARCLRETGLTGLAAPIGRVARLGVPGLAAGLAPGLADAPPHDLLMLAEECATDLPELSAELLGVVARQGTMTYWQRHACRDQLERHMFMVGTVERCFPNDPVSECEILRRLLAVIVIPDLPGPDAFGRLLSEVSRIGSAPLLRALAMSVPPGSRVAVLAEAGNIWLADNGLPRLAVETPPPAPVPAARPLAAPLFPDQQAIAPDQQVPDQQVPAQQARRDEIAELGDQAGPGTPDKPGTDVVPPQETPRRLGRTEGIVAAAIVVAVAVVLVLLLLGRP